MLWHLCALLLVLGAALGTARAQEAGETDADLGEAAAAVRDLRAAGKKTLIFVFDVSSSMTAKAPGDENGRSYLERAREATINLLRAGTSPGDRVVLMTFGAGYETVFDQTLRSEGDKEDLVERVPSRPRAGTGTNIRKPHHDALKILDAALPNPGAVVLLTDSFNDEPKKDDPAYAEYLKYYTPGGRLQKYPDTPENRDYERLLAKVRRSQQVKIYGIGVRIDESGRPVERLPQAAPPPPESPAEDQTSGVTPTRERDTGLPWPWILGALALLLLLGGLFLLPSLRSVPLRIAGGPAGPKDFQVKSGGVIRLGGEGAGFAHDAYPLPGVQTPAALVRGARGQLVLLPGGAGAGGARAAEVFHNGLPLEKEMDLSYGDEVRVSIPDPSGVARNIRLKFEDPKKSF